MRYRVTTIVEVEGPDWPEGKPVPKMLLRWPSAILLPVIRSARAVLASEDGMAEVSIEAIFPDEE